MTDRSTNSACQLPRHWPVDSDWTDIFADFFDGDVARSLFEFVESERVEKQIFPAAENVFKAFEYCSYHETRIVILGQDPYHAPGQAHGLCFSVPSGMKSPPSLKNIFKELESDLGINNDGETDLTPWAQQGVLLLNTVLTVESGQANSHRNRGWEELTDLVIKQLVRRARPVVFVLWGKPAAKKAKLISGDHPIIESAHPSPLSAYRGFFGSKPFSAINQLLIEFGDVEIDWQL